MRFIHLSLKRLKRLELSNIEEINIAIVKNIVLLIGSNGSGKSTIIEELSPLPANHQNYRRGGHKIIIIEHNNNHYELKSIFYEDKPRYHFIKNGEELNPGKTMTVYKELVYTEFKLTTDIHNVLIGKTTFEGMSVAQRRKWFTNIPGVDYEYAIQYYRKLKERTKVYQTTIKDLHSKLIKEKSKLLDVNDERELNVRIKELTDDLHHFIKLKPNREPTPVSYNESLTKYSNEANRLLKSHSTVLSSLGHFIDVDTDKVKSEIVDITNRADAIKYMMSDLAIQLDAVRLEVLKYEEVNIDTINNSSSLIESCNKDIESIISSLFDKSIDEQYGYPSLQKLNRIIELVNNNLSYFEYLSSESIPDLNNQFTQERLSYCIKELSDIDVVLTDLNNQYNVNRTELQHQEKHRDNPDTECPKCNHVWKAGYDYNVYNRLLSTREKINHDTEELTVKRKKLADLIETISYQVKVRAKLLDIERYYPDLSVLVADIQEALITNPSSIISYVHKVLMDLKSLMKIHSLKERIDEINKEVSKKADYDAIKLQTMKANMDALEVKYNELSTKYSSILQKKRDNEFILQQRAILEKVNNELEYFTQLVDNFKRNVGATLFYRYVNSAIVYLKTEISVAQESITNNTLRQRTVKMIEDDIKMIETKSELLEKSCEILSPTTGLIAQGLTRFLNAFASDMNHFISLVWSYPLELVCEQFQNDEVDLDFKFKVAVNDNDPVDDVSSTSSGQKEIIDLAFRKINTNYLGLTNHPLYLDEFGTKMDHAHRNRAVRVIEDMITESSSIQVFMVSHYSSAYSSLNNAQVIILHPNNVVVPAEMKQSSDVQINYYER